MRCFLSLAACLSFAVSALSACDEVAEPQEGTVLASRRSQAERPAQEGPAESEVPVEPSLRSLAAVEAKGMLPVQNAWTGTLKAGAHRDVQVVLEHDRCYRVLGQGQDGVVDMDLLLFDSNGQLVQQDLARDANPVLGLVPPLCPETAAVYRLRLRFHKGEGRYVAQLFVTR